MKANKRNILLLLVMVVGFSTLYAQSKQEKKEQKEQAVKKQIESENYKIAVNIAYPRRGRTIHVSGNYSVTIRNDSVFSYLPYYGRAYSLPYGGGEGLIFDAPINEYRMVAHKKGAVKIDFVARSKEDRFKYNMTIFSNGSVSITVNMQNRESINFSGALIVD